jgi:CRP-like cAMP-binding protein
MPKARAHVPENHLIALLSRRDRSRVVALSEPFELVLGDLLCEPGKSSSYVYFPIEGFISLLTSAAGSPGLEVGMVGNEGMLGSHLALGVATSPVRAMVQGTGVATRIEVKAFRGELAKSPSLQRVLGHYIYVLMSQQATAAACMRYHQIGPRLARWLLMSQDRAHSTAFRVTQEFLAHMLGVRRVGVTAAARALHLNGLIEYRRGNLKVLDRAGLEAAACGCYAADRRTYDALL